MRTVRCLIVAWCAFVIVSVGYAQQAKPTRVVLTLKDGKTVSGELVEATPAGVTLKPNAKAEPIMTPWSSIKLAGGGLSRDAVVEEWRKTKADQLCEACTGSALMACTACTGTGVDPAKKETCAKCEGLGSTGKCRTPNCVDGKIPCPNTCLKAEMFTGAPDPQDGKRKKKFRGKDGTWWWSDGHIGELIVYEEGNPVNKGKCPRCEGTSRITDPACKGTAKTTCATCRGNGVIGPNCAACEKGQVVCTTCTGTGLKSTAAPATPAEQ